MRMMSSLKGIASTVTPWAVILLLIYLALFTHPKVVSNVVIPPPISVLDRFYDVAESAPGELWLVGSFGKIIKSDDNGRNWIIQRTGGDINLQAIASWDASTAIAVGDDSSLLLTRDGGATWEERTSDALSENIKLMDVDVFADGQAWMVGDRGSILRSLDRGETWQLMREREDVGLQGFARVGERIWVVGEFGTILHSGDDGATWELQDSGTESYLSNVAFRDPDHGVVVGLDGVILVTDDGGATWSPVQTSEHNHYFAIAWDGSQWFITGANGLIATADAAATDWDVRQLGTNDFSWHTSVRHVADGWLLTGSSVGVFSNGDWQVMITAGNGEVLRTAAVGSPASQEK